MKRLGDTNSQRAFMSICQTSEERCPRNGNNGHVYSREFQSILDGLDEEECGHVAEKKRRLGVEQVKALEKSFEVENKLEPDRKVQLAHDLGLQPRQVAVWFQNRRARWKTKQLERDYNVLKANFDFLKHNFDSLNEDKQALLKQIGELKSKLGEDGNTESDLSVKEEITVPESDNNLEQISEEEDHEQPPAIYFGSSEAKDLNFFDRFNNDNASGLSISVFKDGSSDSDSSAILNEDSNSPSVAGILMYHTQTQSQTQTQFVKLEEHDFFSGEEACNFFSDDQPPTLQQWYCPDPWNPS